MSVLRRAYVDVEPDVSGFDDKLREKFAKLDPGGKAGRQLGGQLNRALKRLDLDPVDVRANPRQALAAIDETERKLRALSRQASTVEIKVRAEQGLKELSQFRRKLGNVGEQAGPGFVDGLTKGIAGGLQSVSMQTGISAPIIGALAAAGAAGAPVFVSALASGLSAGAGAGVLGVGLAALAKNPVVKARGAELGANFMDGLTREANRALSRPALKALDRIDDAGKRITVDLGKAFDALAPHIDPFTQKVLGAAEAVTGSLTNAARQSGPALDGLGDSVTLLGDGVSYFIDAVADGGPEAAGNLRLIAGATADLLKYTSNTLTALNKLANNEWVTGPLLPLLRKHYAEAAAESQRFKEEQAKIPPELKLTADAARGQREALTELATEMKAQTDPAFALLDAQGKLKKAQDASSEAIKKYGRSSDESREATRKLAMAAIDMQGKAGALGGTFAGKLTPSMIATYRAAGLTESQISDVEGEFVNAKKAGDKYDGKYVAEVSATGVKGVFGQFNALLVQQRALQSGISLKSAQSAMQKDEDRLRQRAYDSGGWTGPGSKYQPAGIVHADEYVIKKESRQRIERDHPGALDRMNNTGRMPGYDAGGHVWPFPTTAAGAKIPSLAQALAAVAPRFSRDWPSSPAAQRRDSGVWRSVVALIKSTGPLSGSFGNSYRPGDPLWHGSGRAVDWMGFNQDALATFLAARRPLELIHRTSRRDYAYTRGQNMGSFGEQLMNEHRNHIHIAMDDGGMRMLQPGLNVIPNGTGRPEPIAGPNAMAAMAGRTYNITINVPPTAHLAEAGRHAVLAIQAFEASNGNRWRR